MQKTAILIDGEWFRRRLDESLEPSKVPNGITADVMYRNALLALRPKEESLFRIFYYDCPPFEGKESHPISGSVVDFSKLPKVGVRRRFLREFGRMDHVAMRLGINKKNGWTLTDKYVRSAISGPHNQPAEGDVYLSMEQKGVDMRIGIDVATLSLKRIVERIILISGDTDMIPAIKLARREGVQIILVQIDHQRCHSLSDRLHEDCDLVRKIQPNS
jgi:uncharacterized LabA/DUF88 family protein